MRRTFTLAAFAAFLAAIWLLAGCSSPSETGVDTYLMTREQTVDLDDEWGGFNFGDESPAFNDAVLLSEFSPDTDTDLYDDEMSGDPTVVDPDGRTFPRRYLMITWGNLDADSLVNFPTNWSGGLAIENGVVLLRRTIRFEPGDKILPRETPQVLEWQSFTQPHFDGVIVSLHRARRNSDGDATLDDTIIDAPISVTFRTEPLTITFTGEELRDLHRVIEVDDAGNAVAFNTIVVEPQACPRGFLAGHWRANRDDRPGGVFRGKWISENGAHMGYLRGHYGLNRNEERVFFGKWTTQSGRFQGLLRGRYGVSDDHPGGWFRGRWITRELRPAGHLGGIWRTSDRVDGGGFFKGEWQKDCP